jgi:glycosyltransferase involved in cell wall biosynthesis
MADVIYVHSDYTRDSFIDAGINPDKLERTYLSVAARFTPPSALPEDDIFRVVYVGRIEFTKGIHLLFEAFEQLPIANKKLILVGGWSNREMRKYAERWLHRNPEIQISPGDPLPVLHKADVFVHPTYQDGFGYAPMEALACGVPVIVTEDTGMKEYVREGINGYVIPTGDGEALSNCLLHMSRAPMKRTQSDPPLLPPNYAEEASPV